MPRFQGFDRALFKPLFGFMKGMGVRSWLVNRRRLYGKKYVKRHFQYPSRSVRQSTRDPPPHPRGPVVAGVLPPAVGPFVRRSRAT